MVILEAAAHSLLIGIDHEQADILRFFIDAASDPALFKQVHERAQEGGLVAREQDVAFHLGHISAVLHRFTTAGLDLDVDVELDDEDGYIPGHKAKKQVIQ